MNIIRFSGTKKDATRKALSFYYDNLKEQMNLNAFLNKCKYRVKESVLYFYYRQ